MSPGDSWLAGILARREGRPAGRTTGVPGPECRATRAALRDYLKGYLLPHRRRRLEAHLDGCAGCIRAFIDVREVTWTAPPRSGRVRGSLSCQGAYRDRRPPRSSS